MPRFFRSDLSGEFSVNHTWEDFIHTASAQHSVHTAQSISLINQLTWYPQNKLVIDAGVNYQWQRLDSTETGTQNEHSGGASLRAEYQLLPRLSLHPSLALSIREGTAVPVPKLGVVWNPHDAVTVQNNYYRVFAFPGFEDKYWSEEGIETMSGNPDLKNEDGIGVDVVVQWQPAARSSVNASLYATWVHDAISWTQDNGRWHPANISEAAFFGVDLSARYEFPLPLDWLPKLSASFSYYYLLTRIMTGALDFSSGILMPYTPMHRFAVSLEAPVSVGTFRLDGRFEGKRYTETSNTISLKPYFLLDLGFDWRVAAGHSVFVRLNNLLNTPYQSQYDRPMPGITVQIGVSGQR
jgi:outer membrane receptor protein involved in Fe transport